MSGLETASDLLTVAAWASWLALGNGSLRSERSDIIQDHGTVVWGWTVSLASVGLGLFLTGAMPWAGIPLPVWSARFLGATIALLGSALRQWAVVTLGRFFTQAVMMRSQHHIVSAGPYRLLRHPGYTGTLLTLVGLGLSLENWVSLAVMTAGFFLSHIPRITVEEEVLELHFGEEYRQFQRTRKRLIPGVW